MKGSTIERTASSRQLDVFFDRVGFASACDARIHPMLLASVFSGGGRSRVESLGQGRALNCCDACITGSAPLPGLVVCDVRHRWLSAGPV